MKQGTVRSWFDGESYGDEMRVYDIDIMNCPVWTVSPHSERAGCITLDIWRAGRDGPRSTYGERARRIALVLWRAGRDEPIGFLNLRTCHVISFFEDLYETPCYEKHFLGPFGR